MTLKRNKKLIWVDRDDSRIRKVDRSDSGERRQGIVNHLAHRLGMDI